MIWVWYQHIGIYMNILKPFDTHEISIYINGGIHWMLAYHWFAESLFSPPIAYIIHHNIEMGNLYESIGSGEYVWWLFWDWSNAKFPWIIFDCKWRPDRQVLEVFVDYSEVRGQKIWKSDLIRLNTPCREVSLSQLALDVVIVTPQTAMPCWGIAAGMLRRACNWKTTGS